MTGQEPVTKFTEHGKVEAWVREIETQEILPVDTGADRLGGLIDRPGSRAIA